MANNCESLFWIIVNAWWKTPVRPLIGFLCCEFVGHVISVVRLTKLSNISSATSWRCGTAQSPAATHIVTITTLSPFWSSSRRSKTEFSIQGPSAPSSTAPWWTLSTWHSRNFFLWCLLKVTASTFSLEVFSTSRMILTSVQNGLISGHHPNFKNWRWSKWCKSIVSNIQIYSAHVAQRMSAGLEIRTGGGSPVRDASAARYLLPTGMACGQWQWPHIHT